MSDPIAAFVAAMLSVFGVTVDSSTLEVAERGVQVQLAEPPAPPPVHTGPCAEWVPLLIEYSPGWDVSRMQRIMNGESRCQPGARNPSGARGLLQLMPFWANGGHLRHCGVYSPDDLLNPVGNICGAAEVWRQQGEGAWDVKP